MRLLPLPADHRYKRLVGNISMARMFGGFFPWWTQHLLECLPAAVTRPAATAPDALLLRQEHAAGGEPNALKPSALEPNALLLASRRRGRLTEQGRFLLTADGLRQLAQRIGPGRGKIVLFCPPETLILEKPLTLPLAVERDLDRVLAYEMDRETPFTADEIYWHWDRLTRNRATGMLSLRLSLIPCRAIAPILTRLAAAGIPVTALEAGPDRQIPLDAAKRGRGQRGPGNRLAAGLLLLLAAACVAVPFLRQSTALADIDRRLDALDADRAKAEALRHELDSGPDILTSERQKFGDPLKILAATTAILPDDSWLTDFSLHERKISLLGQSAAAARLIGALAADPTFKDPVFAAPVTRLEGAKTDVFSINAEIRP